MVSLKKKHRNKNFNYQSSLDISKPSCRYKSSKISLCWFSSISKRATPSRKISSVNCITTEHRLVLIRSSSAPYLVTMFNCGQKLIIQCSILFHWWIFTLYFIAERIFISASMRSISEQLYPRFLRNFTVDPGDVKGWKFHSSNLLIARDEKYDFLRGLDSQTLRQFGRRQCNRWVRIGTFFQVAGENIFLCQSRRLLSLSIC